jgi:hypothetical protein
MMATSEERLKILQMIQDEKITAEDGARLLAALSEGDKRTRNKKKLEGRYIRVRVTDLLSGKNKVSVNLPLGLIDAGLNIASSFVPDIAVDDITDAIQEGMTGKIVDVVDEDNDQHVEIFIE